MGYQIEQYQMLLKYETFHLTLSVNFINFGKKKWFINILVLKHCRLTFIYSLLIKSTSQKEGYKPIQSKIQQSSSIKRKNSF